MNKLLEDLINSSNKEISRVNQICKKDPEDLTQEEIDYNLNALYSSIDILSKNKEHLEYLKIQAIHEIDNEPDDIDFD